MKWFILSNYDMIEHIMCMGLGDFIRLGFILILWPSVPCYCYYRAEVRGYVYGWGSMFLLNKEILKPG